MSRLVIIESPFSPSNGRTVDDNLRYLRACMRHSLLLGEAPFASHGLYTQPGVLDDAIQEERDLGIEAGFAWRRCAQLTAVYHDLGITPGMQLGIDHSYKFCISVEWRSLGGSW